MLLHSISLKVVCTSVPVFHLGPSVHLPLCCALSGTENHQPCLGPDPSEDWGKAGNGLSVPSQFLGPQGSPDPCAVTSAALELCLRTSNSVSV